MNMKHAKSPCCRAQIRRFGGRRRQCIHCKKTWTLRPKKRGRPSIRISQAILKKVFLQSYTLRQLTSKRLRVDLPAFRYRFRQALHRFVARPCPQSLPPGPLVLLADGLWFKFGGKPWILYLAALKSCSGNRAVFLDPLLLPGKEGASKWKQVLDAIPAKVQLRIQAIVVDNLRGMQLLANRRGWVLQLCQFHLLLKLQIFHRGQRYALQGGEVRREIEHLVRSAISVPKGPRLTDTMKRLHRLSHTDCGTVRIQAMVMEFVECIDYYRSCQTYPKLGLPATNNTVESMGRIVREMFRRNRAGSNPQSLLLWATAFTRLRPEIVCNGKNVNR